MSELYELPDGWEWKPLNKVFIVKDGTHDSPKYIEENGFPLFTSKNLKENGIDYSNFKLISEDDYNKINQRSKVDKGDLLFAMIGTIGNPTIIDKEPNFAIKNVALFKPMNSENKMKFLRYYFLSNFVIDKMVSEANGATQKFVGLTYLRNFPYPAPPLPEQQRIVSKLDLLFEKIDKSIALHQKNMDEANAFMGSILNDVFGELEDKYDKYKLNEIVAEGGKTISTLDNRTLIYFSLEDIEAQSGKILKYQTVSEAGVKGTAVKFDSECVLYSKLRPYLNKVAISEMDGCSTTELVVLRPKEILNKYFLASYLRSPNIVNYLHNDSMGAKMPRTNMKTFRELKLALPPLPIQQKTVTYLDEISQKIEKIKRLQKEKMASLKALKASILDSAFRGEL